MAPKAVKFVNRLTPELQEKAVEQLKEDPKRIAADIEAIKDWLKKQPHLRHIPITEDEELIVIFLRGCKFSLERTKEKFDLYFSMRGLLPEFFKKTDPLKSPVKDILAIGGYLPLPNAVDKDGRAIIIIRTAAHDPAKFLQEDIFKCSTLLLELFMRENPNLQVCGVSCVLDMRGSQLGHMTAMRPPIVKKMMTMFQDAYPVRTKGIHYTYMPQGFELVMNIFKNFMKEKMKQRLHLHGEDMDSLHSKIPKESLPPELGGTYHMDYKALAEYWQKRATQNRDVYLEWESYHSNEKFRPGKPKTYESIFGMEGSFRKLEID